MNILIAGGSGFVGQFLTKNYLIQQHTVTIVGRSATKINAQFNKQVTAISWKQLEKHNNIDLTQYDLIINLAGANIATQRWSERRKQEIIESRTISTALLVKLCLSLGAKAPPLFNASAIGIYSTQPSINNDLPPALDETTPIKSDHIDFASDVVKIWENMLQPAIDAGLRVTTMRFGVVLGKNGGALARLKIPVLFGLGGPIGNGQQPFSWICIEDLARAIDFIYQQKLTGVFNFVAPHCVTQKQLVTELAKQLHRPSFLPTPAILLKLVFGQMAEDLLLKGQHIYPKRLLETGFSFKYPTITSALHYCLTDKTNK